jgi:MFS family permease
MVDISGHLGMALLWLAPAWLVFEHAKTAATFVLTGLPFGMGPDLDLVFSRLFRTIRHHGIFHTVLAVTVFATIVGPVVGILLNKVLGGSDWFPVEDTRDSYRFGFFAVWIAGLSHIFADMLSAPDIAQAVEPFWPLYFESISFDLVWYNAAWFNWGLLAAGIFVNVGLFVYKRDSSQIAAVTNSD